MAVLNPEKAERRWFDSSRVYVMRDAQKRLCSSDIWYHLDGYYEDGDTYDTQEAAFSRELEEFWLSIEGSDEPFRAGVIERIERFAAGWKSASVTADGTVRIQLENGTERTIRPPGEVASESG